MRAELESKIAQMETDLAAERAKLESLITTIPQELHNLTKEVFDKLRAFFE